MPTIKVKKSVLNGMVKIGGAKNSVLKIICASLLHEGKVFLDNVPNLSDVEVILSILKSFGSKISFFEGSLEIDNSEISSFRADYSLVSKMRASLLVLGPLLAKYGRAEVAMPGGCNLGSRAIDLHVSTLEKLGANVYLDDGYLKAQSDKRLRGAKIVFPLVSVGATETALMSSVLASGQTKIINAAREPEIVDLCNFLKCLGAKITGIGTNIISVDGVNKLHDAKYSVMGDRIEAISYLASGVSTGGSVEVNGVNPNVIENFLTPLESIGVRVERLDNGARASFVSRVSSLGIMTMPYPFFPTDAQAIWMTLMLRAKGECLISETVFENRFMHALEMMRFGANIDILDKHHVLVKGVDELRGASAKATDLRASFALITTGFMSEGVSNILDNHHIFRGYENFVEKLESLGASIEVN